MEIDYSTFNKKPFERKTLSECNLRELEIIKGLNECLPKGLEITITDTDLAEKYSHIDNYVESRTEEYFNADRSEYEKIVDKCFMNKENRVILKVLALPDEDDEHNNCENFIYEQFEQCSDDWHIEEYIWLQEDRVFDYNEKYAKISKVANMNINAEGMYMLGKDGNLYVDTNCGGDYDVYTPAKESLFQYARAEAFENDVEYFEEKEDEDE